MKMPSVDGTRIVLAMGMLLSAPSASLGAGPERAPVATTPHFTFYSDFATNLNDALIVAGSARNGGEPELFHAGEEASCFGELAPSARAGWNRAVDYYAEIISPVGWSDRQQWLLRMDLASLEEAEDDQARGFVDIAGGFWATATPAYRACRWATQDAENRRWVDNLKPRLAAHGPAIARRLEQLYQTPLHGLPIGVDIVPAAPPVGADTIILAPAGGHILVSSAIEERDALEIVYHEASHTLAATWRHDPLPQALAQAAKELDVELPGDLWHVVLFYTTGEAVRRTLEEAGKPGYTPYVYVQNLWDGRWGRYRDAIEQTWPAYVDGERTLSEAALDLLRALGEPGNPP